MLAGAKVFGVARLFPRYNIPHPIASIPHIRASHCLYPATLLRIPLHVSRPATSIAAAAAAIAAFAAVAALDAFMTRAAG